ncbi:MAG: type II secretion system protein GspK [Planctomycetota bacterium]|jgi:hypothetical protein
MKKVRKKLRNSRNAGRLSRRHRIEKSNRSGIVLLVTLVLLVVLSTLGYTLSSRVAAQRHRDYYIIDYQAARYGCDSALKYAFATLSDINTPQLIDRSEEPDFSDLFALTEVEYKEFLAEWTDEEDVSNSADLKDIFDVFDTGDNNDVNNISNADNFGDSNSMRVRGPYGPPWPLITDSTELEVGSVKVRIEIEDENAKYPIAWALLDDEEIQREANASFETFCEWMDVDEVQMDLLKEQLKQISDIRPFTIDLKPIRITRQVSIKARPQATARRGRRGRRRPMPRTKKVTSTIPVATQVADFAKFFHSSMIDTDALARPTIISENRKESALKYMGMWASRRVNINTAPRQVLEAAFTFGGDAKEIAEEIIERRRIEPFENFEDLRKSLFRYSDSIKKCEKCITTASSFFTIKVTATSGKAKASAIIAVMKEKDKWQRIAVISG